MKQHLLLVSLLAAALLGRTDAADIKLGGFKLAKGSCPLSGGAFYPLGLGDQCTGIFGIVGMDFDCTAQTYSTYFSANCSGDALGGAQSFECTTDSTTGTALSIEYGCATYDADDVYKIDMVASCGDPSSVTYSLYLIIDQCLTQDYDGTSPGSFKLISSGSSTATFRTYESDDCSGSYVSATVSMDECSSGSGGSMKASGLNGQSTFTSTTPSGDATSLGVTSLAAAVVAAAVTAMTA